MSSRHRRRPGDSDEDIDEEQFLQPKRQESSLMSRQSSVRSLRSQKSVILLESQGMSSQQSMSFTGLLGSLESQQSQTSAAGISREYDYLFRSSQNDEQVIGLDVNSPVSLSIGVVCVAERQASDNNMEILSHVLQKTFYSYPKNAEEQIKRTIENRIENDVANFKLQGYNVTTYTFGLPFSVEAVNGITRGYDGKTKMLRASKRKNAVESRDDEPGCSSKRTRK
jgi:hypothetical protein